MLEQLDEKGLVETDKPLLMEIVDAVGSPETHLHLLLDRAFRLLQVREQRAALDQLEDYADGLIDAGDSVDADDVLVLQGSNRLPQDDPVR